MMLVYHQTKNDFHRWAYVPADDRGVPLGIQPGEIWSFVMPDFYDTAPIGPADYAEAQHAEVTKFQMRLFRIHESRTNYRWAWSIIVNEAAGKVLECENVASFPYARKLSYV